MAQGRTQLRVGLGVAMQHQALGGEARAQGQVHLASGGHVAPKPLGGEQLEHGAAGEGLGGEHDLELVVAGVRGGRQKGSSPGPEVPLGDHVGGRPELPCQLDQVAAADLQAAVLVDAAAQGKDLRYGGAAGHQGLIIALAGR